MELVENARTQLEPLIVGVLDSLDEQVQVIETSFFTLLLIQLRQMAEDADLMNLFLELSTTAFQGFVFSESQLRLIDEVLATAEYIAFALTAEPDSAH